MGERSADQQREYREARYRKAGDRQILERLPNGLCIVRARKHEPIDFAGLSRIQMAALTDKRNGSKFATGWGLVEYVDWIETVVAVLRWGMNTGPAKHTFRLAELVGVYKGESVHTIEVTFDGRNLHAYPVEDK